MTRAIHKLMIRCWKEERVPSEWDVGVLVPLPKPGADKHKPSQYRGITLLSIVAKVYAKILNARMKKWIENNNRMSEAQHGFRENRGTHDCIFALTEHIKMRKREGKQTYVAYLDIKKAYDKVNRNILWKRLREKGMSGKIIRVIQQMYERVENTVMFEEMEGEKYNVEMGVKQGCVMSCILFTLFLDEVQERIETEFQADDEYRHGLTHLLFADDVALVANTHRDLQRMLNCMTEISHKSRFEFSTTKSQVVVYGEKKKKAETKRDSEKWKLSGERIDRVKCYKYLGVELDEELKNEKTKERMEANGRRALEATWSFAARTHALPQSVQIDLWCQHVRPSLEYASCWMDRKPWPKAETLQREMARRILGARTHTPNDSVLGELGWMQLSARRDLSRLKWWGKIVEMPSSRITKQIYSKSKEQTELKWSGRGEAKRNESEKKRGSKSEEKRKPKPKMTRNKMTWCDETKELMMELEMETEWRTEKIGTQEEWTRKVTTKIHQKEQREWRARMKTITKLDNYRKWKKQLKPEQYLQGGDLVKLNRYWTQLRVGSCELRVETMRFGRDSRERKDRQCVLCAEGGVEDEEHLLFDCTTYTQIRNEMMNEIETKTMGQKQMNDEKVSRETKMRWMMRGEHEEVRKATRKFVQKAIILRMQLMNEIEKKQNQENAKKRKEAKERKERAKQKRKRKD